MRVIRTAIDDDGVTLKGSDMVRIKEVVEDSVGVSRDIGALVTISISLEDAVHAAFNICDVLGVCIHLKVDLTGLIDSARRNLP
jgi:hypothetical protein